MQIKEVYFKKEASANDFDGRLYWFGVVDLNNKDFDFFIPVARTALHSKGLSSITETDLLNSFQEQLITILADFIPESKGEIASHRFTFALIDSDYSKHGANCLTVINRDQGIKVKIA
jgi:hypothetical protein